MSLPHAIDVKPRASMAAMICVLIISVAARVYFIYQTPHAVGWNDLCIYIDGGQLVVRGINPYDHSDGREERQRLQTDQLAHSAYVDSDQGLWDYYASSNLPLSLLFYGLVEKIADSDPTIWRWVLAACDCLLSLVVAYYVVSLWPGFGKPGNWIAALLLGALSPLLLAWGVVLPEDKGPQILLMLGALLASRSPRPSIRLYLAPVVLGLSIAFKGLGVFIAPLCLYYAVRETARSEPRNWRLVAMQASAFVGLALLSCAICFAPFGTGVWRMMLARLQSNLGTTVGHGSLWRYFHGLYPETWSTIRLWYLGTLALLMGYGCWRRRVAPETATALVLIGFTIVLLLYGSMDRMHIGILVSILLLGEVWPKYSGALVNYYAIGGLLILCNVFVALAQIPLWHPICGCRIPRCALLPGLRRPGHRA